MNVFERFFKAINSKPSLSFIPAWMRTAWMDVAFRNLVQDGYKDNSAVFACIRALSFSFPEPQLTVYQMGDDGAQPVKTAHPLQQLIRRPNPDMGEAELMQFVITYCSIGGNIYLWKQRNRGGKTIALWPFHDGDMKPIPGHTTDEGVVGGYEFDPGDGNKIILPKQDVIHWKWMVDPKQPWRGMGAVEAAARDISSDSESTRYAYALLKNDAVPRVAVTLREGEDDLTEAKANRLRAQWKKKYGGESRGEIAFLQAGMTIQKLGLTMQELDLGEIKNIPESRICAAFGVPPVIAGLNVGLKRSDYGDGQARKSFTETTLAALWRSFSSEMTNGLAGEYGDDLALIFDLSQVRALQENINELWTRINTAVSGGYITRAEARRSLGFTTGPEDEVYRESLTASWEKPGAPDPTPAPAAATPAKQVKSFGSLDEQKAASAVYGRSLQRIRKTVSKSMVGDLDTYFASLADRVVSRAGKALSQPHPDPLNLTLDPSPKMGGKEEGKELPGIDDLLTPKDEADLIKTLKRWFVSVIEASWETMNLSLGITVAFDLNDPAVTKALAYAGEDVKNITVTTREALQAALKYGNDNGWSIQQLVRGDETQAGIRSIVEETYKNRAQTIARTELGNAQNTATSERYFQNGVVKVEILDNGNDDDDDACKIANGQIWTLAHFQNNRLEHPNCTRCAAPYFGDEDPDN